MVIMKRALMFVTLGLFVPFAAHGAEIGELKLELQALKTSISILEKQPQSSENEIAIKKLRGDAAGIEAQIARAKTDAANPKLQSNGALQNSSAPRARAYPQKADSTVKSEPVSSNKAVFAAPKPRGASIQNAKIKADEKAAQKLSPNVEAQSTSIKLATLRPKPRTAPKADAKPPKAESASASSSAKTFGAVSYETALNSYKSKEYSTAISQFKSYTEKGPSVSRYGEAMFYLGDSYYMNGEWKQAARAYLESYSKDKQGPRGSSSFYKLGLSLDKMGKTDAACLTLQEFPKRYPESTLRDDAAREQKRIGCS